VGLRWSASASGVGLWQNGLNGGEQVSHRQCHRCTLLPLLSGRVAITFPCHHPPPRRAECLRRAALGSLLSGRVRPTRMPCHITSSSGRHRPSRVSPLSYTLWDLVHCFYIVLCASGFARRPHILILNPTLPNANDLPHGGNCNSSMTTATATATQWRRQRHGSLAIVLMRSGVYMRTFRLILTTRIVRVPQWG